MRKVLKWAGIGLLSVVALAAIAIVAFGWREPRGTYMTVNPPPVPVPTDPEAAARGRYVAHALAACGVCHGEDLGGQVMSDSRIFGYIRTPNLTPGQGGVGRRYTDVDWIRAIRHGLTPDGRVFAFMPVDHYFHITDADLGDMIAYMKSLPPADNEGQVMRLGLVPKAIMNSGIMGDLVRPTLMDHDRPRPTPPADRGAYLALIGGCDFCHGSSLRGGQGPEPGAPPGPDITGGGTLARYSFEDFQTVMRSGVNPQGHTIAPPYMPWFAYRQMTDEDLKHLYDYLRGLPASGPAVAQVYGIAGSGAKSD
jgi:mono/diheme cytochrome c family protein